MANSDFIKDESELGPNWIPAEVSPIVPGKPAPPPASSLVPTIPQYLQGTVAPNFQHDAHYVDTEFRTPNAPKYGLMPLGASNAISSAQITSIVKTSQQVVGNPLALETNGTPNPNQSLLNLEAGPNVTLAADSSGGVTISAAASSGLFTSRPDFKRWALWTQSGNGAGIGGGFVAVADTLVSYQAGTTSYNLVSPTSSDDYGVELQEGITAGAFASIVGVQNIIPARDFSLFCPTRISTNSGNIRVWVVLSNPNNPGDASAIATSDTPNRDIVGFRFNPAISPNWFAVMAKVNPGGGLTAVDTGVAATAVATMLRVNYTASSTTAAYFINGVQVATINTNPPTINFQLGGMVSVASTGNGTNAIRISSFYTEARTAVTTN